MASNYTRLPRDPFDPPEREGRPLYYCAGCGEGIYEGDNYYELFNGDYCLDCADDFKRTAYE